MSNKLVAAAMANIAKPMPAMETTIANLCVDRDVNKPDDKRPTK
jgi:hypothetical protein